MIARSKETSRGPEVSDDKGDPISISMTKVGGRRRCRVELTTIAISDSIRSTVLRLMISRAARSKPCRGVDGDNLKTKGVAMNTKTLVGRCIPCTPSLAPACGDEANLRDRVGSSLCLVSLGSILSRTFTTCLTCPCCFRLPGLSLCYFGHVRG